MLFRRPAQNPASAAGSLPRVPSEAATVHELRFQVLSDTAVLPEPAHEGDAGIDLRADEPAVIGPGERASVGTGLAVAIPPGHGGLVLPRSGLAMRHGITLVNTPGLIDSGYRGELRVLLLNTDRDETFTVERGDRIAQLMVVAFLPVAPVSVAGLDSTERGTGGFGSSGTR